MPTDRKSVKFGRETYDRAKRLQRDGETWDAFLERAMDALEDDAPNWDPADDRPDIHDLTALDDALTTDHIEDIATQTARKTADEVESRLSR